MNISNRKRIVREFCDTLRDELNKNVTSTGWPESWDGNHIRALAVKLADRNLGFDSVKHAAREMKRSAATYALPL